MTVEALTVEDGAASEGKARSPDSPPLFLWQLGNIVYLFACAWIVSSDQEKRLDFDEQLAEDNFLAPAGWAFAIWPVIYLLEMPFLVWQLFQCSGAPAYRLEALRAFSLAFCCGQTFQAFWALSFRYSFKTPGLLWISPLCLSGIPFSFSFAHRAAAEAAQKGVQDLLFMYPGLTMHFGWTTAAALVNVNAYVSVCTTSPGIKLAAVLASVAAAAVLGLAVGVGRDSLLYACTICYALVAVGTRTVQGPAVLVRELGSTAATLLGVLELLVGAGVVVAALLAKRRRRGAGEPLELGSALSLA